MIISVLVLLLAAFALVVGALAWTKLLPGNSLIGLKTKEVRTSRDVWDTAHAAAGPAWVLAGMVLLFGGLWSMRLDGWLFWFVAIVSVLFALVVAGVGANLGARVAEAAMPEEDGCGDSCNCGSGEPAPAVDVAALRAAMNKGNE